jgi:predicted AAA+ superfamily ATPase
MRANIQYPRVLKAILEQDLSRYPVVAVMGARQVGKSTLCRQLAEERGLAYCSLDEQRTLAMALSEPDRLIHSLGDDGAFIDEAQRAPGLFLAIKAVVDRRDRPGQYLLSGSNQPRVSSAVGDSLLGRAVYRTLRPLTLSELRFDEIHHGWSFLFGTAERDVVRELERRAQDSGPLEWQDVVSTGGFPQAVVAPADERLQLLDDYVTVFATRDIREVIGIDSSDRFESFLRLTAARVGQTLNYSGLAGDLGVPVNTIRRWLDALRRSYLVELVAPYSRNVGHRVIKAPKLFAVDSAFALAAARENKPTGFHLENLVATDLATWSDGGHTRAVYHWRLGSGQEVDFIAGEEGALVPIEVKTATSVTRAEAKHLRVFLDRHDNALRALLLSGEPQVRILAPRVIAAPWWAVL